MQMEYSNATVSDTGNDEWTREHDFHIERKVEGCLYAKKGVFGRKESFFDDVCM